LDNWRNLFAIRDDVLRALEEARTAKRIGSPLEAHVTIETSGKVFELLQRYQNQLRYLFIVSEVSLVNLPSLVAVESGSFKVKVEPAEGKKCDRCWNYSTRVGESGRYPTVCERCIAALAEIENAS
jgi:isoleucyl-tRNA synthetase